ncbi:YeeE/YedE family protein [Leptospira gomenensis]|uniref:YeeE/YedE family protein n=1 Tax=Leptospira gomenensis TaxID=2484974 RepID=A0A5F1Y9U1_9LEPT|nr:YeeE/YedE thiosulfate transporter family protein [Leptospira gomenensis]TGK32393.1 YeeE/YedE family protein [Leptospira gomenensis]TGK43963.1 YeeE/YedE family protein [Leptospira gomenensis]TGK48960.1 YeeE/YedE family protein [Leptospira gomenensis]TGK54671.1 YeeE/YedE family protein [Leptospira gomenensis]
MVTEWIMGLVGGAIIGIAVSLMLLWNGRVTGVSSIVYGVLIPVKGDVAWRWYFIVGLLLGGLSLKIVSPGLLAIELQTNDWIGAVAGVLVGFGAMLGGGCTSGHGVCGVSRVSARSIVATVAFMTAGMAIVFILRKIGMFV